MMSRHVELYMKEAQKRELGTSRNTWTFVAGSIIILIIAFSCVALYLSRQPSDPASNSSSPLSTPRAAIVDQLSIHSLNQTFIDTVTSVLTQAGYEVDYYEWENVTIDFFRNLPTQDYALIILRTHSGAVKAEPNYVCIFSSEIFSETKYRREWREGRVGKARFLNDETYYFAITPAFVRYSMKGSFRNATIIMMGCDGLAYPNMAKAFIKRGAKAYISWDGPVSTYHTDTATCNLLNHLVTEEQPVPNAVAETMHETGSDPISNASLLFHPRKLN